MKGANVENASYGAFFSFVKSDGLSWYDQRDQRSHVTGGTICAERTAIVKAVVGAYFFQHIAFYSRRAS